MLPCRHLGIPGTPSSFLMSWVVLLLHAYPLSVMLLPVALAWCCWHWACMICCSW